MTAQAHTHLKILYFTNVSATSLCRGDLNVSVNRQLFTDVDN